MTGFNETRVLKNTLDIFYKMSNYETQDELEAKLGKKITDWEFAGIEVLDYLVKFCFIVDGDLVKLVKDL